MTLSNVDLFLFGLFLILNLCFLFIKVENNYFGMTSRSYGSFALASSLYAQFNGAGGAAAYSRHIYEYGYFYLLLGLLPSIKYLLEAYFIVPHIHGKGESIVDIISSNNCKITRALAVFSSVLFDLTIIILQMRAMYVAISIRFGEYALFVFLLVVTILMLYTMIGGLYSVIMTDIIQSFFIFGLNVFYTIFVFAGFVFYDGPINDLQHKALSDFYYSKLFHVFLPIFTSADCQRILVAKNPTVARDSFMYVALFECVSKIFAFLPFAMLIMMSGSYQEMVWLQKNHYVFAGYGAYLLIKVLMRGMSTADSSLNSLSMICARETFKDPTLGYQFFIVVFSFACFAASFYVHINLFFVLNFYNNLVMVPFFASLLGWRFNYQQMVFFGLCTFWSNSWITDFYIYGAHWLFAIMYNIPIFPNYTKYFRNYFFPEVR